jgi:CheY-like chemotaxis protein
VNTDVSATEHEAKTDKGYASLKQEQAVVDLDQSIADRQHHLADIQRIAIDSAQEELDNERAAAPAAPFDDTVKFERRQGELDRRRQLRSEQHTNVAHTELEPRRAVDVSGSSSDTDPRVRVGDEGNLRPARYPNSLPRLMIADDDSVVLSVLGNALSERFEVVGVAADSEEAIALAGATQPDVALVDVEMPKGGGVIAVQGIREISPRTAIVVLSCDESDASVRKLIQAGATAYLRKGVDLNLLAIALTDSIMAHGDGARKIV